MLNALSWPADTPAATVWRELWAAGIDLPFPQTGQPAADWLARLSDDQLEKIHYHAQEGNPHE